MPTEPSKAALQAAEAIRSCVDVGHCECGEGCAIYDLPDVAAIIDRALEPERKAADELYSQVISFAAPQVGGMVGKPEVDAYKAAIRAYRAARGER